MDSPTFRTERRTDPHAWHAELRRGDAVGETCAFPFDPGTPHDEARARSLLHVVCEGWRSRHGATRVE